MSDPIRDIGSLSSRSEKPKGKRGRPRLQRSAQSQTERRRAQIRDAQRTYRLKKESAIQNLEQSVVLLQSTVNGFETLFRELYEEGIELAIKENNSGLMQLFAKAGVKFERIFAISKDPDSATRDMSLTASKHFNAHKAQEHYKSSTEANDNVIPDSFTNIGAPSIALSASPTETRNIESLGQPEIQPSQPANTSNGLIYGFPQDLIPGLNEIEDTSRLEMSSIKEPLDNIQMEQQQEIYQQQQQSQQQEQQQQQQSQQQQQQEWTTDLLGFRQNLGMFSNSESSSNSHSLLSPSRNNSWSSLLNSVDKSLNLTQPNNCTLFSCSSVTNNSTSSTTKTDDTCKNRKPLDMTNLSRSDLQKAAKKFLQSNDVIMRLPPDIRSSVKEQIFQMCLVRVLNLYIENRFRDLERIFNNEFQKHESYQIGRLLKSLHLVITYTYSTWTGRTDDDSLFPGYCSPASAEKYFYASQNAGNKIDKDKFVKMVSASLVYIGHLPRFALSDVQSAIVLATEL